MSFGKMQALIDIAEVVNTVDSEGFAVMNNNIVASVRAYKEERQGTKIWANRAAFSEASCLFRFRVIPNLSVTTRHIIIFSGERYKITSVENVRGKSMYIEILAELITPSKG